MKYLLTIIAIFFSVALFAQSPFKRMPIPQNNGLLKASSNKVIAYRFTAAAASFDIVNNKVLTGIGFGLNYMHLKTDSLGNSTWYTDFTANLSVYAAGNTAPTYYNGSTNIIAVGPSVGILNKLINIGYVYYPAMNGGKSQSGVILGIYLPLN